MLGYLAWLAMPAAWAAKAASSSLAMPYVADE